MDDNRAAGFGLMEAVVMTSIGLAEGGGLQGGIPDVGIKGPTTTDNDGRPDTHWGTYQISDTQWPQFAGDCATNANCCAKNPQCAAKAAYSISRGGTDYSPWETFTVPTSHPGSYARWIYLVTAIARADPRANAEWNQDRLNSITSGASALKPGALGPLPTGGGLAGSGLGLPNAPFGESIKTPLDAATSTLDALKAFLGNFGHWTLWARVAAGVAGVMLLGGAILLLVIPAVKAGAEAPPARVAEAAA